MIFLFLTIITLPNASKKRVDTRNLRVCILPRVPLFCSTQLFLLKKTSLCTFQSRIAASQKSGCCSVHNLQTSRQLAWFASQSHENAKFKEALRQNASSGWGPSLFKAKDLISNHWENLRRKITQTC